MESIEMIAGKLYGSQQINDTALEKAAFFMLL
jgi:hypothetical protein